MHRIEFSDHQRAQLIALGLVPKVLELLELEALPLGKRFLERPPRMDDVRSELRNVYRALEQARRAVDALRGATGAAPHRQEAWSRVRIGPFRAQETAMLKIAEALPAGLAAVAAAIENLPEKPARHQSAAPAVVNEIDRAVQTGFLFSGMDPLQPELAPSSSPTSRFRTLVGICYEAMGAPNSDPERAIKAYLKQWRELEALTAKLQAGQNVPGDSGVPS